VQTLSDLLRGALDLVFAPTCVACGGIIPTTAIDRSVCVRCWSRARPIPLPRCPRCSAPLPFAQGSVLPTCKECPQLRPAIRAVRSAFLLENPVRSVVHALKYRGWPVVAVAMAQRMAAVEWPDEVTLEVSSLVPVPISSGRRRQRGYNQAALLAGEVARFRGLECLPDTLQRARSSGSQTTLHPTERRANVARAFRVPAGEESAIAAQHVMVVDDVWTTGATALACAEALLDAGARAVSILTFARALPELERLEHRLKSLKTQ
jgi:ComF family protein